MSLKYVVFVNPTSKINANLMLDNLKCFHE